MSQATKEAIDKSDFIKIKNFLYIKRYINTVKRQLTEYEKIFSNYIFDKGLISRYRKDIKNSGSSTAAATTTKKTKPNSKMAKGLE